MIYSSTSRGFALVEATASLLALAVLLGALTLSCRILIARSQAARWLQGAVLIEGGRPAELEKRLHRWLLVIDTKAICQRSGFAVQCQLANGRVQIERQELPGRQPIHIRVLAFPNYWVNERGARYDLLPGGFL